MYFLCSEQQYFSAIFKQISFIHVDKDDPAEVVNLGDKEEEEVTDEMVFDKKKVVKLVCR